MVALRLVPPSTTIPEVDLVDVARDRAVAELETPFVALSPRAAVGGALGAMTALSDVVAPGLGPVVDMAIGAATALVAVDGALAVGRREGTKLPPRALFVRTLRQAADEIGAHTTPGAFLALAGDFVAGKPAAVDLGKLGARLAWSGLRRLATTALGDLVPGVSTVARVVKAGEAARRAALLVTAMERAAEQVCRDAAPATPAVSEVDVAAALAAV